MIRLRFTPGQAPKYMTKHSAAADLHAAADFTLLAGKVGAVPTGVWIDAVAWDQIPGGLTPELQIRARSGLAFKHAVTLANGIGTIDADFPDEIKVLLINHGEQDFVIHKGDRIAQIALNFVMQIPDLMVGEQRVGGFGSTGVRSQNAVSGLPTDSAVSLT